MQTPQLPPSFAHFLQYLQFLQALQGLAPVQVATMRARLTMGLPSARTFKDAAANRIAKMFLFMSKVLLFKDSINLELWPLATRSFLQETYFAVPVLHTGPFHGPQ
ncbi:MAG: hypothetical protein V4592_08060 [Bacteroidota bacterium]